MFIPTIKKSFSAIVLVSRQDITNSQFTTLHSTQGARAKGQGRQSQPLKKKKKNLIQCCFTCLLAVVHHSIHSIVQKSKHKMHNTIIQLYNRTCNDET